MGAHLGLSNKMGPFPYQGLPRFVRRMGFAGKDELNGPLRIGQKAKQPLRVVQQ